MKVSNFQRNTSNPESFFTDLCLQIFVRCSASLSLCSLAGMRPSMADMRKTHLMLWSNDGRAWWWLWASRGGARKWMSKGFTRACRSSICVDLQDCNTKADLVQECESRRVRDAGSSRRGCDGGGVTTAVNDSMRGREQRSEQGFWK